MTTLETLTALAGPSVAAPDLLTLRAALPGDGPALDAMHERCSLSSRVGRWHAPIRSIPRRYLEAVTGLRPDHVAFVIELGPGHLVGLGSAALVDARTWEIGVLVEDEFQQAGWGRRLLDRLAAEIRFRGGTTLLAQTLSERRWVLNIVRPLGPTTVSTESGVATAVVALSRVGG